MKVINFLNIPEKSNELKPLAESCAGRLLDHATVETRFVVFMSNGRKSLLGLEVARCLKQKQLNVLLVSLAEKGEPFLPDAGLAICYIHEMEDFPDLDDKDVVIDALCDHSHPSGKLGEQAIHLINHSKAYIVSLDMPSGLLFDESSKNREVMQSDWILTIGAPKLPFFFAENAAYCVAWTIVEEGYFVETIETEKHWVCLPDMQSLYLKRPTFSNKWNYGHALLIGGSKGKMGAAVLASEACLRTGAGLLTAHVPAEGEWLLQMRVPEAMTEADEHPHYNTHLGDMSVYHAVAIGPGLGREEASARLLRNLIANYTRPVVFDADAINLLAEHKTWLSFIPPHSVFTPHHKEFERLTQPATDDFHRHQLQVEFSVKYQCIVVLKGAYTCITTPAGKAYFNSTGNPGMATAGSGDVLTGMILGLLSQGYTPFASAMMGVYLHGLSADLYVAEHSEESLIAGDIPNYIGKAFKYLQLTKNNES